MMPESSTLTASPFRMGDWEVFPRRLTLVRGRTQRQVARKVMDAAVFLSQRPGVVVTKEELMEDVWPGVHVSDGAIRRTISQLRDALDDDARAASSGALPCHPGFELSGIRAFRKVGWS